MTDKIEPKVTEVTEAKDSPQEKESPKVPLSEFLEVKKTAKELKEKLAQFEGKEKSEAEAKLLEEKKYQELIDQLKAENESVKTERENERKNFKLEKLQNKFQRELEKVGAVDSDDALKFVSYDDLLDAEKVDDEVKKRVEGLVKAKSYLFSAKQRSVTENRSPNSIPAPKNTVKADPAADIFKAYY